MNVKITYQHKIKDKEVYRVDVIAGFLRLKGLEIDLTTGKARLRGPSMRFGGYWFVPYDFDYESESYKQFVSAILSQLKRDTPKEDAGDFPF